MKIIRLALILLILSASGTTGYMLIEGWNFLDAFYMTVITLTTTGFQEVHHLSESGKIFTTAFLMTGFALFTYILSSTIQEIVDLKLNHYFWRKRMENRIAQMEGHTIICGFGKMGNSIVQQLTSANFPIVVIETDPEREEEIKELQCNYIIGNADNDETLIAAGIQNAANLVSVISSDPENVFIALTARNLNPRINIIARANHTSAEGKLIQAGANRVISPYALTSAKITKQILSPLVEDFLDTVHLDQSINFKLSGFFIEEDSPYVNKTLLETDLREKGIIIIGIRKKDGERIFAPSAHSKIEAGDHLISFGNEFTG